MSKKIRHTTICGDEPASNNVVLARTDENGTPADGVKSTETFSVGNPIMTADQQEKLEKYEAVMQQNEFLLAENAKLLAQLDSYIKEVAELKKKPNVLPENDHSKELAELAELKSKLKSEEDAQEQYLIRISELTFDNARLNAQLKQLQASVAAPKSNSVHTHKQQAPSMRAMNGYSSWN